jgi:hypothetical protein
MDVILRHATPNHLVVEIESCIISENEILRGAEGPERSRGAQDEMGGYGILSALGAKNPYDVANSTASS